MRWPELDPRTDAATWTRLHLASQMIGKIKLANSAWTISTGGADVAIRIAAPVLEALREAKP